MLVRDLIQMLQDLDEDTEVRLMTQSNWPFEYSIERVIDTNTMNENQAKSGDWDGDNETFIQRMLNHGASVSEAIAHLMDAGFEEDEAKAVVEAALQQEPEPNVVYIVEGTQLGYGRKDAWY